MKYCQSKRVPKNVLTVLVVSGLFTALSLSLSAEEKDLYQTTRSNNISDIKSCLIPQPNNIFAPKGDFLLNADTRFMVDFDITPKQEKIFQYLADQLQLFSGLDIKLDKKNEAQSNRILLKIDEKLPKEGYELDIDKNGIVIQAATDQGLFYGWQTLMQLFTKELKQIEDNKTVAVKLPFLSIQDAPQFPWRGFMLDSARHFQKPEMIKRYLDLMAFYKLNRFHWHLTDDSGWRIEIEKYPKLTKIGAFPGKDEQEVNGFYTKQEIREIVAYAKERFITVIPEIDMPGHATAAIFCYPELSCKGEPLKRGELGMDSFIEINKRIPLCAGNDKTIAVLKDILDEVMQLFDGPIHIGGDERPKGHWNRCEKCQQRIETLGLETENQLQNWMMNEINKHLLKKGRRSVAWAENIKDGVPENQIVQVWHNGEQYEAVEAGRQMVFSIHGYTYLDYPAYKGQKPTHAKWMKPLSLESCYRSEPIAGRMRTEEQRKLVIGIESPLWTENVLSDRIDVKVFPRILAIVETGWTEPHKKNALKFYQRVKNHYEIMDVLGIKYDSTLPELKSK